MLRLCRKRELRRLPFLILCLNSSFLAGWDSCFCFFRLDLFLPQLSLSNGRPLCLCNNSLVFQAILVQICSCFCSWFYLQWLTCLCLCPDPSAMGFIISPWSLLLMPSGNISFTDEYVTQQDLRAFTAPEVLEGVSLSSVSDIEKVNISVTPGCKGISS